MRPSHLAALLLLLAGCAAGPRGQHDLRSTTGLAYDLDGAGPVVVLVHGTNLDRRMWDDTARRLARDHRVLRLDLRGQGASADVTGPFANHADLLALLDEVGADRASIVGLSSGAQVALDVALVAPERVDRIVLVSPSVLGYVPEELPPFIGALNAALRAGDFERANQVILDSSIMSVPPRDQDRVRAMVETNTRLWSIPYELVEGVDPPAFTRLESIGAPALVLVGDRDLVAVRDQARILAERLPDARLIVVPGGGHLLNMTSPEAFGAAVGAFLDASAPE